MSLAGTFETLPITEVLGLLAGGRKTGALKLSTDAASATVYMRDGSCSGAQDETRVGAVEGDSELEHRVVDVCFEVARHDGGTFEFEQDVEAPFETPGSVDVTRVVAQLEEMLDQWASIREVVPSLEHRPRLNAALDVDSIEFDQDRWKLLVLVDGRRTVMQITQKLDATIIDVGRELASLVEAGAVRMSTTAKKQGFADVELDDGDDGGDTGGRRDGLIVPSAPYGPGVDDADGADDTEDSDPTEVTDDVASLDADDVDDRSDARSDDEADDATVELASDDDTDDVTVYDVESDEVADDDTQPGDGADPVAAIAEGDEVDEGEARVDAAELGDIDAGGPSDGLEDVDRGDATDVAAAVEALRERGELPEGVDAEDVRDRGALLRLFSALRDS